MNLFPVFLKLNELHTVLIGAGNVGLEKLTACSITVRRQR
jgi:siroheme synthase (precorrin-2 oxidase/ferrochelatase)